MGEFGIPDLYLFYFASNMVPLVQLLTAPDLPQWVSIECLGIPHNMIKDKIWQSQKLRTMEKVQNHFWLQL